jgi:spore coat protein U-like protein
VFKMMPALKYIAVSTLLFAPSAFSATDGTLGVTSTFSYNVTITIPERVSISGLQDIAFGQYPGTGDVRQDDDVCIYSNTSGGNYDVTITGDGAGSAFTIASGGNTIPYRVFWNDVTGTAGQAEAATGVTLSARTAAHRTSTPCSGGNTANIDILMEEGNVQSKPNGSYSGVVTIVIEPN